ncbi:MAG TPA: hypothetical protein VF950_19150 [Planctomycetota bacterium]
MPSLKGPIIGLIAAPLLTWATYSTAIDIQNGVQHEYTGRRAGTKKLFAFFAESLGPTGVLVVGGAICLGMIAWLVFTLKKRKEAAKA